MDYNLNGKKLVYLIQAIYTRNVDIKCARYHFKIYKVRIRLLYLIIYYPPVFNMKWTILKVFVFGINRFYL